MPEAVFLSFHRILAAAWRRRYLIAVPILVMPIFGMLISIVTQQKWETHTTILIQETAKLNPFLEDLSVATNLEDRVAALDTLIHSRHILQKVARDLGLLTDASSDMERDRVIAQLSNALTFKMVGKDLVKITYTHRRPDELAKTLQAVRDRFLENLLAPEQSSISASESFLQKQLDERRARLSEAESKVAEFKRAHASELPDLQGANITRLRQLKEELAQRQTALAGAKATLNAMKTRLVQVDPVIGRLEEQIVNVTGELALLRARYTDQHSKVQAALRKLSRLEEERKKQMRNSADLASQDLQRLWALADGMSNDQAENPRGALLLSQLQELQNAESAVQRQQQEVASIEQQLVEIDKHVANSGDVERGLTELVRDLDVQQGLYTDLLKRFEKARVTGALGRFEQPERVKIIDEPFTPSTPINLPMIIFIVGGIAGGLTLGAGMALMAELTDTTVRYRDQLAQIADAPVLTRIPAVVSPKPLTAITGERL